MSNHKAARIAVPMLAQKPPATPEEVGDALYAAEVHAAVIREWVNEAHWRRRSKAGSETMRGRAYRNRLRAPIIAARYKQDKGAGADTQARGYRPGLVHRMILAWEEHRRAVRKRKAQRKARKATRRGR